MTFDTLSKDWERFAQQDPLWAILTEDDARNNNWDENAFFQTGKDEIAHLNNYLQTHGLTFPQGRALDFGCGVGRLTRALEPYFTRVIGVDVSKTMIDLAQTHNHNTEKIFYFHNPTNTLRLFSNETFSFVYTSITLQHISQRNTKKYLKEFVRILKPGGLLIFQLPDTRFAKNLTSKQKFNKSLKRLLPMWALRLQRRVVFRGQPIMEINAIPKRSILRLMKKHGMTFIDAFEDQKAKEDWVSWQYCFKKQND